MDEEILAYSKKLQQNKPETPIWEKDCLTIEEAASYSGIGTSRIRSLINQKKCPFVIQMGNQCFVIRKKFDTFLEEHTHI